MIYIIDLTLILQNVFWLQALANEGRPLSRRLIKLAAQSYNESNVKQTMRFKIARHLSEHVTFNVGPDTTLQTIVDLIESETIETADMLKQKGTIPPYHLSDQEEDWDPQPVARREVHVESHT